MAVMGLALAAVTAACEVVVSDDVPHMFCLAGPGTCPAGQTCRVSSHTCVAFDASEGSDDDAAGPSDEGGVAPLIGCSTLGCACSSPQGCMSGICGDTTVITPALYQAAEMTSFCTTPCCTSADCDAATVCIATGVGGSYCVRPEWLGRDAGIGMFQGGAPCEADSDCRSSLCAGGACADVCCSTGQSAAECTNGTSCQFGTFPGRASDQAFVPFCSPPVGTGASGAACAADSDCASNLCAPNGHCYDACRNTAECGDPSLECGYAFPTAVMLNEIVSVCETSFGTAAHGGQGAACQNNDECQSGFCDASSMQCTDVCYTDADCTPPGWRCRPDVTLMFGSRTYSAFGCGS
jgi:hypothetical protein